MPCRVTETARPRAASWLLVVLVIFWSAPGWGAPPAPRFAESTLTIESTAGRFEFRIELATSPAQRAHGLMYRRHLAADRGMLFDFGAPRPVSMWMRNTYIPLDMLFIRKDGAIARIVTETEPLSEEVIASGVPVKAVL